MFIREIDQNKKHRCSYLQAGILPQLIIILFSLLPFVKTTAQNVGNNWIDANKVYYKFPVTNFNAINSGNINNPNNQDDKADYNGLRRISKSTLDAIGLGNANAEDLQMWRNGEEVPLYITKSTGALTASDYIEFWGEANDGIPDLPLFRLPEYQLNNRWSFFSDTASYFLTVNAGHANARIINVSSDPLNSSLTPDAYFMHTIRINYRQYRFLGFGMDISDKIIRSSSFDNGEGWSRVLNRDGGNASVVLNASPLYQYETGPLASFKYTIAGEKGINRSISVSMKNGASDSIIDTKTFNKLNPASYTVSNIPYSRFSKNSSSDNSIKFFFPNGPYDGNDRIHILQSELSYARSFNFSGAASFLFYLPASQGNLFDVTATGIAADFTPYILDLTNNKRYTAVKKINPADTYAFELGASVTARKLVFVAGNTLNTNYQSIDPATVSTKTFTDFTKPENQPDYIIISNNRLFNSNGVNYVDKYREYRASAAGGGFQAKVFDIDSITDQFSYGIRKNPLAIYNFISYAQQHFANLVKYVFLIGHGVTYNQYSVYNQSTPNLEALNLVPTWGYPASDNLLVANQANFSSTPKVPIGRLSVVNGQELSDYLDKVKEYELLQSNPDSALWQKNVLHLIGGSDVSIVPLLQSYMDYYKSIIEDTLAGAKVNTYLRVTDPNVAANNAAIQQQVSSGTGLVTYFGHSSSTSLDFNINDPYELSNTGGRYPVFLLNGCNASEFYTNAPERLFNNSKTLSEKFIIAKERGAIAFMSSSHFGVLQYLDIFNKSWYNAASRKNYANGIGDIMKTAINDAYLSLNQYDFYNRATVEEFILHADPAVKLFTQQQPDYEIDSNKISFNPAKVNLSTDSVTITCSILNPGKAISDSVWFELLRRFPNGVTKSIYKKKLPPLKYSNTVSVKIPVLGIVEKGLNNFRAIIDSNNLIVESNETNNAADKTLLITDDDINLVYPYNFSIVNSWPVKFAANVVNPMALPSNYKVQIDTTQLFNSSQLVEINQNAPGNIIEFTPAFSAVENTVYYWRVARIENGSPVNWSNPYSYMYLSSSSDGFNQSHYYQHLASSFDGIEFRSDRRFHFDSTVNNLYLVQGIYPTSGTEDGHFSITINGNQIIRSACVGHSIIFNVFDSLSFRPWSNAVGNRYGSGPNCAAGREYNFEFPYYPASNRKLMMDFLDSIPKGMYVAARLVLDPDPGQPNFPSGKADSAYAQYWKKDSTFFGSGKSLYHALLKQGFTDLDQLNSRRTFGFVFKKDDTVSFKPSFTFSDDLYDRIFMNLDFPMLDTTGKINSPWFGPAKSWTELHWRLKAPVNPATDDGSTDSVNIRLYGMNNGVQQLLGTYKKNQQDIAIDTISASQYPFLKMEMIASDADKGTAPQLDYWRLNGEPVPEGIISPAKYYEFTRDQITMQFKDTLTAGPDSLKLGVAFQNVSKSAFADSVAVQLRLIDSKGKTTDIPVKKVKPLPAGDTAKFYFQMPSDLLDGDYNLLVNFNPGMAQKEMKLDNNFMFKPFVVKTSSLICPGSNTSFVSDFAGTLYQWQVDDGHGNFVDIANTPPYSNVTTNTLNLVAPSTSMYGYRFRCIVDTTYSSRIFTLKFGSFWTGSIDTAWENAGNWNCGSLPDANTDVYINSGKINYPVVNSNPFVRSVNMQIGSSVQVTPGKQLTITGK